MCRGNTCTWTVNAHPLCQSYYGCPNGTVTNHGSTGHECLYRAKRQKIEKQVAWRHKFVCLAYRDQERIPTVDAEKEELYQAGLGEKKLHLRVLQSPRKNFEHSYLITFHD